MKKKKRSVFKWILLILLILAVILCGWNQIYSSIEKKSSEGKFNGNYVNVDGRKLSYEIFGEGNDNTIIFLPASCEFDPSVSYRPFLNEISKDNKVVVLEPFGYGLSDESDKKRNVENTVEELHSAAKDLGLDHYYLMAHSWGGVHSLLWANKYPDEVAGFIGIDPSAPGMEEVKMAHIRVVDIESVAMAVSKAVDFIGINRLTVTISGTGLDESLFSKEEIDRYRYLRLNKAYNSNIVEEIFEAKDSLKTLSGMKFPETVPVLNLVSSSNCESMPEWKTIHEAEGNSNPKSKLVVVEGDHYLTSSNPEKVLSEIRDWLSNK